MASRLACSPSRLILDLLKQNGPMTRQQLLEALPRDMVPSKTRVTNVINVLRSKHRVVPFLQTGKVKGIDNWVYKLNPMYGRWNFPASKKRTLRDKELAYVLALGDDEPILGLGLEKTEQKKKSGFVADDVFDPSKE